MVDEKSNICTDISKLSDLLENAVKLLSKDWPKKEKKSKCRITLGTGGVGGKYGEVWVANKLIQELRKCNRLEEYDVQIGDRRKNKGVDIYVECVKDKNKNKKIEVKWSSCDKNENYGEHWGWGFGKGSQITKEKFDYCVLIQAEDNGTPKNCYMIPVKDFKEGRLPGREGAYRESGKDPETGKKKKMYAIHLFTNYNGRIKSYNIDKCELEMELHNNPEKYKNKWEVILEGLIR